MYSLDVNFLKDRPEFNQQKVSQKQKSFTSGGNWTPLYIGLAVGLLLPALVGAGLLFLQSQNAQLEQTIAELDQQNKTLDAQIGDINKLKAQTNQIKAETNALASVFNQIKPWSAMLQDFRTRIPAGVQIEQLRQIAPPAPQQGQPPTPNAVGGVEIIGNARSFNDVNDFLLTLQRSSFFKDTETKIITAELVDSPVAAVAGQQIKPPQVVRYTIQSSISDVPASDLLRELDRNGTVGLVTRIRTLQQQGVIQK